MKTLCVTSVASAAPSSTPVVLCLHSHIHVNTYITHTPVNMSATCLKYHPTDENIYFKSSWRQDSSHAQTNVVETEIESEKQNLSNLITNPNHHLGPVCSTLNVTKHIHFTQLRTHQIHLC